MVDPENISPTPEPFVSSVYGPVSSWRYGQSLGIDPIIETSYCSFNCVYCQLGYIQQITAIRKEFFPAKKVIDDLKFFDLSKIDVITFSGNGEPTLASNFGAMQREIRRNFADQYSGPIHILTNATMLDNPAVVEDLMDFDEVCCKIDAVSQNDLEHINRPAQGINIEVILKNIALFAKEYQGDLTFQTIVMPNRLIDIQKFAEIIREIQPKFVFLNRPKRPYPRKWELEYRGSHTNKSDQKHDRGRMVAQLSLEEAQAYFAPLFQEFGKKVILN